jgi:hypothetical protein
MENSLTSWINLAKYFIDQKYKNTRLTFLALAILLENVDRTLTAGRTLILNAERSITIEGYLSFRRLQSW